MLISNKLYSSLLEMPSFDYIILGTNFTFNTPGVLRGDYFHQSSKMAPKLYTGISADIKSSQFLQFNS